MKKDFDSWNIIKKGLQDRNACASFEEREIWWCSIGLNVGDEEDGKGENARRPVLVLRKFNKRIFWGVPLTTKVKDNPHYYKIQFKEKEQCAMLTQLKLYDSKRLGSKMGRLSKIQLSGIRKAIAALIPYN